jgi:hypothetical protein
LSAPVLLVTATGGARGSEALAAALAVCAADEHRTSIVAEVGAAMSPRRPTLLASPAARRCEAALGGTGAGAAARGLVCFLGAGPGEEGLQRAVEAVGRPTGLAVLVLHVEAVIWQAALDHPGIRPAAAVLRAELPRDRSLASLAVRDLRARGLRVRVAGRQLGWAPARRALAGVRTGGADEARLRRWAGLLLATSPGAAAQAEGGGGGGAGGALPGRTTSNWAISPWSS